MSAELAHFQRESVREHQRANLRLLWTQKDPKVRDVTRRSLIAGLHEAQREVVSLLLRGARYIALCCGRRGGKTHLMATLIHLLLLDAERGQDVVFIAPTLKRGKELIWGELARLHELYCFGYQLRAHQGTMHTHTGATFRIVGLDNQRQVGKIARGGNTRAFLADEVQEFSHLLEPLIEAASPALAQTRGAFIASGTPGYVRRGYWHALCHNGAGFVNVSWTLFDNPFLGRDPHEIIAEEKLSKGWSDTHPTLLREYFAKWVDDETRRVCEISDDNIVDLVDDYSPAWRHFIGVDYGNAPDPTAWVVLAAHPNRNLVVAVHSESKLRLTSDEICTRTFELKEQFAAKRIVGDSASGGKTFIQDFNSRYALRAGFSMSAAEKHDKAGSIDMLNTELRTGRFLLLREGAAGLIAEMQGLMWDEDHDEFLPGPDHCFVAGTPVLTARGEVPIETVRPDDSVLTRAGFRPVVDAWCSSLRAATVVVRFDNGAELVATPNHPVFTPDGWRALGALKAGDAAVCLSSRPSSSEVTSTAVTPIPSTGRCATTSTGWFTRVASAARSTFTAMCGSIGAALSLPSTTCTTSTGTRSTTAYGTLSASTFERTTSITPRMRRPSPSGAATFRLRSAPRQSGTEAKPAERGTASTASARGAAGRPPSSTASSAARRMQPWFRRFRSSAAMPARLQNVELDASTTSPVRAQCASASSPQIATSLPALALSRVLSVDAGPAQPVYDVMVDGEHEFFADGVLVHNCYDATRYAWRSLRAYLARPLPAEKTAADRELERIIQRNRQNARGGQARLGGW